MKMKTSATLLYLKKEADGFFVADHHYDCGYIRTYVKQKEMNITQYINYNLRTISETVDDLLSMGNKTIIFCVDESNYMLNSVITKELKMNDDRIFIVWFGKAVEKYKKSMKDDYSVDLLLTNHYAENIYSLLTIKPEEVHLPEESIKGIHIDNDSCISPYMTEIIPVNEVGNTGTRLYRNIPYIPENKIAYLKTATEELDFFQLHHIEDRIQYMDEDLLASTNLFCKLLESIIENKYSFSLSGKLNIENLTEHILRKMMVAKFDYIEIQINQYHFSKALLSIKELISIAHKNGITVNFSIQLPNNPSIDKSNEFLQLYQILKEYDSEKINYKLETKNAEEYQDNLLFRNKYPQYLAADILLNPAYKSTSKNIQKKLVNEYISYLTGYYHYRLEVGDVRHIEIEKDIIPSETYRKLSNYLGINTSIINRMKEVKESITNQEIYNLDDYAMRSIDNVYDHNLLSAQTSQTYFSHYYQLYKKEERANQMLIDDYLVQPEDQILEIPYSKIDDHRLMEEFNLLKIETKEDLEKYLEDVQHFDETGQFNHLYEVSSFLIDGCRWGGPRQCSLTKLHRFRINENEDILPCGGCNKTIGNLDDSMIDVIDTTFTITQEEESNRGCATCEVRDVCSKCSFLPEFMTAYQYCSTRKNYKNISGYMEVSNLIYTLSRNSSIFSRSNLKDLKVSSNSVTHTMSNSIEGGEDTLIKPYIYLIYLKGDPMIVNGFNFKVSKVSKPLAFIFEGLLKRVANDHMISQIAKSYYVDEEKAAQFLKNAWDIFFQAGYLSEKEGVEV